MVMRDKTEKMDAAAAPELSEQPRRRTFSKQTKLRVLAEADVAAEVGGIGAIQRREGLTRRC